MNTQNDNSPAANRPISTDCFAPAFDCSIAHGPRPHPASKISRLPAQAREFINQSIADNLGYPKIILRLEQMGHHGISPQNISKWARSGYRIWLNYRQNLDLIRIQSEADRELLRELGTTDAMSLHRVNDIFMAKQVGRLVRRFNVDSIEQQLLSDPMNFFRLSRSVSAHTRNAQRQQKLQNEAAKQHAIQLADDQRDLGHFQPTTSEAGYNAIAAALGLPPRFSVPLPVLPKSPNSEPQTTGYPTPELSNVKAEAPATQTPSHQTS